MQLRSLLPVLAAALMLGACASTAEDPGMAARVKAAQDAAVRVCGFLPIAETVIDIIGIPGAGSAVKIADRICAAVKAAPAGFAAPPVVEIEGRQIPVRGQFVR
jgi:hypothetical protein